MGTYKTITISACRDGEMAFNSWKFSKSFSEHVSNKIRENNGAFNLAEDV